MRIKLDWQGKGLMPMQLIDTKGLKLGAIPLFMLLQKLREEETDIPLKKLADMLKCSTAAVRSYLKSLIETGWAKKSEDGKILYLHVHSPRRPRRK